MKPARIRDSALWLGGISIVYFVCAGMRAASRPFWYDELVTWHLVHMASVGAMLDAMVAGADQQMPLNHILARLCYALFGDGGLSIRLPALIGFWIMLLGMYCFLSRRLPKPYALIGMLFPMLTYAWPYAFEARAYGVAMGAVSIAMIAWQDAAEGRRRPWSLVGVALGLATALLAQAVFAIVAIPFALGELTRTLTKRRIDWPMWLAFAAACPVAILFPYIMKSVKHLSFPGMQPHAIGYVYFFDDVLKTAVFPVALAIAAGCWAARGERREDDGRLLPRHEAALLIGFLLAPLPFFAGGLVWHGFLFTPRYAMVVVFGLSCWFAVIACRVAGSSRRIGMAMLVTLFVWVGAFHGKEAFALRGDPAAIWRGDWGDLEHLLSQGPVVSGNLHTFLEGDHYLPPELASHLYWINPDEEITSHNVLPVMYQVMTGQLAKSFPLRAHVVPWREFGARGEPFYLLLDTQTDMSKWCYDVLPREGWRLEVAAVKTGYFIYRVEKSQPSSPLPR